MKIVQINSTCGVGSTGRIAVGISEILSDKGIENYIIHTGSTNGYSQGIPVADGAYIRSQAIRSRILGNYGFNSKKATKRIIAKTEKIAPDIVHIHNIHSHDCDLEELFSYFKRHNTRLIWTFHDCWAFTGYCPHYFMAGCQKWQTECGKCVQRRDHSLLFDRSRLLFCKKKALLSGLDMTVVTPSRWLAGEVKKSFLKDYPVEVIYNGIDLDIFKPTSSSFRQKYGLEGKKLVLGVAFGWCRRKGLDVFVELSKRLPEDYRIVLVGTDGNCDRKLPKSILSIHRTESASQLAEIYTAADVFVNPTREDTLSMTNIEALACGTPAVTFKAGGAPECVTEDCGCCVEIDDITSLENEIIRICTERPYTHSACTGRGAAFDKNARFKEYLELYERIVTSRDKRDRN